LKKELGGGGGETRASFTGGAAEAFDLNIDEKKPPTGLSGGFLLAAGEAGSAGTEGPSESVPSATEKSLLAREAEELRRGKTMLRV